MKASVVVMGVAGCGKSSMGMVLARALDVALVEGDDFHSPQSREKMRQGIALTDQDRAGWLDELASQLQSYPQGVVLACSALKRAYRDRLRAARPGLHFIYLDVSMALATQRVADRGQKHFFATSLVQSQFATLEPPAGEARVLRMDAALEPERLLMQALDWLRSEETV